MNIDRIAQMTTTSLLVRENAVLEKIPPLLRMSDLQTLSVVRNPKLKSIRIDLPAQGSEQGYVQGSVTPPIQIVEIAQNDSLTEISLSAGLLSGRLIAILQNPALAQVSMGTLQRLERLEIRENTTLQKVDVGALETVDTLSVTFNPSFDPAPLGTVRTFSSNLAGNAPGSPSTP